MLPTKIASSNKEKEEIEEEDAEATGGEEVDAAEHEAINFKPQK